MKKPYNFKDEIKNLSYEELIKMDNVLSNKVLVGSTLGTGSKITDIKISGSVQVGSAGYIKGGQTAYNTGTGFFLGYSTDTYKFSIGNPNSDYFIYDGSNIKFFSNTSDGFVVDYGSNILLKEGGDIKFTSVVRPSACTAALIETAGNVDEGTHRYSITFVNSAGETNLSNSSNIVTTDVTHKQVQLSNIAVSSSASITQRKIYRTKAGGTDKFLLATINDNITTTYTDNIADASLTGTAADNRVNNSFGKIWVDGFRVFSVGEINTFVGLKSGLNLTTGYYNTAFGYLAMTSITSGWNNTAVGAGSLEDNTTGYGNTAVGLASLTNNTDGYWNTAVGYIALQYNTNGIGNTAVGAFALRNDSGLSSFNTAVGELALYNYKNELTTYSNNTAMGASSCEKCTTGTDNTAVGASSLLWNKTGIGNTAIGVDAGFGVENNSFSYNSLFGYQSGYSLTTGGKNSAFGYQSGKKITTGQLNTFLGYNAGAHGSQKVDAENSMALGNGAYTTKSNQIVIGNTDITETLLRGNVGIETTPNAVALLDVSSTTKGFLPPRMTTTQRDAISTPPAGLMIYNSTTNKMNFYNGSAWEAITSA